MATATILKQRARTHSSETNKALSNVYLQVKISGISWILVDSDVVSIVGTYQMVLLVDR